MNLVVLRLVSAHGKDELPHDVVRSCSLVNTHVLGMLLHPGDKG